MEIRKQNEHGIIWHNPNSFFRYNGWPSVCKDDEGTLYAVCSGFRVSHICPFGKTVLFKSWDEGKTWSIPMVINDTWLDDRDAGVICLGGKTILVTWFCHPVTNYTVHYRDAIRNSWGGSGGVLDMYGSIPEEFTHGGSFVRVSHDGGMTWGKTVQIPVSAPHGPILLKDGTILYLGKEHFSEGKENPHVVSIWVSTDEGLTWTKRGELTTPEGTSWDNFHEPHVVELDNGRLIGIIRAQGSEVAHGFTMYQSISDDGGRTWSDMVSLGVCGSPPHIIKHSSGALVLVYGRRAEPFGERALVSRDNGETWADDYVLCETSPCDLGYPASVELSDGSILTVYYQQYEKEGFPSILYTRWEL
ncbi:MAG: exo-alpha-sialidase [Clostridia bacterium]|nr:exo-alpha-sialidase [Clostridia bacterium]